MASISPACPFVHAMRLRIRVPSMPSPAGALPELALTTSASTDSARAGHGARPASVAAADGPRVVEAPPAAGVDSMAAGGVSIGTTAR